MWAYVGEVTSGEERPAVGRARLEKLRRFSPESAKRRSSTLFRTTRRYTGSLLPLPMRCACVSACKKI